MVSVEIYEYWFNIFNGNTSLIGGHFGVLHRLLAVPITGRIKRCSMTEMWYTCDTTLYQELFAKNQQITKQYKMIILD